jgi:hypothetical protein
MPQIIIEADNQGVTWRERITSSDLESGHFSTQLLERLRWAVGDADDNASAPGTRKRTAHPREKVIRSVAA